MKKLLFTFIIAIFGTISVNAQDAPVDPNGPKIEFDTTIVDFGTIKQNSDPFRTVNFKNTGKKPLHITTCQGSCGCTVPTCPTTPIMPGETGELKVRYDTKRIGRISKTVTVKSNATNGTITLRVTGLIEKEAAAPAFPSNTNGPAAE